MINFPDYEYFNNVDIAYSDFTQRITSVINKITPFKEIRIKTIPTTGLMVKFLIRLISGINVLRNLKPLDLILTNSCIKMKKQIHRNLLKTRKETSTNKNYGKPSNP